MIETKLLQAAAYNDALAYLRPLGTLVAIGLPTAFTLHVPLDLLVAKVRRPAGPHQAHLTMQSCRDYTSSGPCWGTSYPTSGVQFLYFFRVNSCRDTRDPALLKESPRRA